MSPDDSDPSTMQVSGTAFQNLTNATRQRQRQKCRTKGGIKLTSLAGGTSDAASNMTRKNKAALLPHNDESPSPSVSDSCSRENMTDAQRQMRRLHRKRVARIVVDQWKWFTKDRIQLQPAIRHHNCRLLLTAVLALQRHATLRQLEWRRAAIFNHKRQYLIQGKCLLLWHAQVHQRKKMQLMFCNAQLASHRHKLHACLKAWMEYQAYKAERRKQHLQASFYKNFVLLTSALQQWKAWAEVAAVKKVKKSTALSSWAARQYGKAFSAWLLGMQVKQRLSRMKGQANSIYRHKLLGSTLWHWQAAVSDMHDGRQAGSEAMQVLNLECFYLYNLVPLLQPTLIKFS